MSTSIFMSPETQRVYSFYALFCGIERGFEELFLEGAWWERFCQFFQLRGPGFSRYQIKKNFHDSYLTYYLRADWKMLRQFLFFIYIFSLFNFTIFFIFFISFNGVFFINSLFKVKIVQKITQVSIKISTISVELNEKKKEPWKNLIWRGGSQEKFCWRGLANH